MDGAVGWTHYLGMIEVPGRLELRGVEPIPAAREITPPPPPARGEMVGPLFAYEVHGEYDYRLGEGRRRRSRATRRIIVHDEGTGRSWLAFTYHNWFAHGYSTAAPLGSCEVAGSPRSRPGGWSGLSRSMGRAEVLHESLAGWRSGSPPMGVRSPCGFGEAVVGTAWALQPSSHRCPRDLPSGDRDRCASFSDEIPSSRWTAPWTQTRPGP